MVRNGLQSSRWAMPKGAAAAPVAAAPVTVPPPAANFSWADDVEENLPLPAAAVPVTPVTPSSSNSSSNDGSRPSSGLSSSRWATKPTPAAQTLPTPPSTPPAARKSSSNNNSALAPLVIAFFDESIQTVKMENPLAPGDKGLAASRWATPAPATSPATTTSPAPAKPLLEERGQGVKMVNFFKPGDKGLSASRWAAPVTPAPTTPITSTASSPPAPAKPLLEERGQGVKMVNTFKKGDKGLAASRWAH
ncbi:hypothetical protein QBC46DRAFT_410785 [Diplogelasinospora grovesii]|uniref:Uncharacterized protein n=1 Tax=Diplogelasinospora grovesii TaxID=303347 RepID=A0AAN6S2W2_9PEZI|nr:hypothetical protein QBC46DRAFT_410785 [Diplogelasinospora grovesii]